MSLTQFIAERDVKAALRKAFPFTGPPLEGEPIAPPLTRHYALVGTAFDYLLRFSLQRTYTHAVAQPWIAELATTLLYDELEATYGTPIAALTVQIVAEAKDRVARYMQDGEPSDALLWSALLLAQIDPFVRMGRLHQPFGIVQQLDIQDLRQLLALVPRSELSSQTVCLLNPSFGASALVQGADVDLILDDCMIDIKTTQYLRVKREYVDQLLGYYLLYRLGGIAGAPEQHAINSFGIYFARHGRLYRFPVAQLVREEALPEILHWFVRRARLSYPQMF
ncbi:hypothetical protein EI42_04934 [Thermosporothrix hazakensis]|jgi:hypothetical protein|uniref:PD-(D/E)XK nuclease superfamily protein n=2 Tax=Thermosporothrix TaxID=768650 RepID=A0A326U1I5_THEHA|nr:hypothetical protein [Thermosporothrix hazakensis]PZW23551.1 hypothetical protein EI42_04934 [Thermosporothrix hazakensis]BBH86779.1 hypothetical protein KTC_15300 [Thermosporothrix sp. COM3]GCE51082.1 hypothetical protein KTH_59510 [Thermosporothrix hazakensis]